MKVFIFITLAALWARSTVAQNENLLDCGDTRYLPSQYTCYDGEFLCPILHGEPTLRCGDACYSQFIYSCDNNQLKLLPIADYPFTVEVRSPEVPFAGLPFQACNGTFLLGLDKPCTFCGLPTCVGGNETIFDSGFALSIQAQTTQTIFIGPNGAFSYDTSRRGPFRPPRGAVFGVTAYEDGAFTYAGAKWKACPIATQDGEARWQIFAELPNLSFDAECITFQALTVESVTGEPGAYYYI